MKKQDNSTLHTSSEWHRELLGPDFQNTGAHCFSFMHSKAVSNINKIQTDETHINFENITVKIHCNWASLGMLSFPRCARCNRNQGVVLRNSMLDYLLHSSSEKYPHTNLWLWKLWWMRNMKQPFSLRSAVLKIQTTHSTVLQLQ